MSLESKNPGEIKESQELIASAEFDKIFSKIQENGNAGKIYKDGNNEISIDIKESDGNKSIIISEWVDKPNGSATNSFELIKDKNGKFKILSNTTNEEVTNEDVLNKILPKFEEKIRDRNDYLVASAGFDKIFSKIQENGNAGKIYKDGSNEISIDIKESDGNKSIIIDKWVDKPNGSATSSFKLIKDKNGSFTLEDGIENKKLSVRELSMQINNINRYINRHIEGVSQQQENVEAYLEKALQDID